MFASLTRGGLVLFGATAIVLWLPSALGAAGSASAEKPFSFAPYGWTGTINEKDEYHEVVRSGTVETQYNFRQPLSLRVAADGQAEVVGAFQGDEVRTEPYACFPVGAATFSTTLTTEKKYSGTIDTKERVTVATDHQGHYFVSFEVPFIKTQVTETQSQSPACPGFGTKTRTFDSTSPYFSYERTVPVASPQPGVPKLDGTWRDPKPQQKGETNLVTVKLQGCGEDAGPGWEKRFPADNRLSALKEPFQQHVRDFIAALRKAGARVRIISVYRPPPRVYLMHYAFRVGYGNPNKPKLAKIDPESVPKYSGPEQVPVCWTVHDGSDGKYSKKLSIEGAQTMVELFGINKEHGPVYPSHHSDRTALDMAVNWNRDQLVLPLGPEAGPTAKQAVVITSFPRTEKNRNLWQVGRSYGVFKYASSEDPQHWSVDGK